MENLLFGISGLPLGGKKPMNYAGGIHYLREAGLDAMELLFVRTVNVTANNGPQLLKAKDDKAFYLSAHGSYYINLNAQDEEKQQQSLGRILAAVDGLERVKGRSLVFHPGFYLKDSPDAAYEKVKANLKKLPTGNIHYRLETTGKKTQFGTLEELVHLCAEVPSCRLCIDFAHIHARNNGSLKGYDDFARILRYVEDKLGRSALLDMHIHIAGIRYNEKGEISHLPLLESDFNYKACLKALKDFGAKGCVISEGPLLEKDALLLKRTYEEV